MNYPYFTPYNSPLGNQIPINSQPNMNNFMQPTPSGSQSQDERLWVPNETAAESYPVAPNSFVRLWDANKQVFYEKRADSSGRPYPMDVFEYSRRQTTEESSVVDYRKEIDDLKARLSVLEGGQNVSKSDSNDPAIPAIQK